MQGISPDGQIAWSSEFSMGLVRPFPAPHEEKYGGWLGCSKEEAGAV